MSCERFLSSEAVCGHKRKGAQTIVNMRNRSQSVKAIGVAVAMVAVVVPFRALPLGSSPPSTDEVSRAAPGAYLTKMNTVHTPTNTVVDDGKIDVRRGGSGVDALS